MSEGQFSFERLIHPVGVDTFLRDYWETQPLLIERGEATYYADILCAADIDSIVGFRQLQYAQLKIAKAEPGAGQSKAFYVQSNSTSDTNQLFHSYAQGDTVVLNFVQRYWEPAARVCSALQSFFHFPTGANVYVTPRHAQGVAPHSDPHDVFVLQVDGSKHWRIYDSPQNLPSGEGDHTILPELLGQPIREIRLNAGDLLYIPRGCVHEARTTDASSIHVSVGVRSYRWTDLLNELLLIAGEEKLEFRKALPAGFAHSQEAVELIGLRLSELFRTLAASDRTEDGIGRLLDRLLVGTLPLPSAHLRSLDRVDELDLDTLVEKRAGMLCRVSRKKNSVELAFPGNRMTGPAEIESAFRFIADSREGFRVRALPDMLSDASKLVLAKRSVREGLLTIASRPAA